MQAFLIFAVAAAVDDGAAAFLESALIGGRAPMRMKGRGR